MADQSVYYKNQLDRLKINETEYPINVKFSSDKGQTNYMNLNDESATVLVKWLKENFQVTE